MDLCLSKFLKIEIMKIVISDHNRIKLDINNMRKLGKNNKYVEIKQYTIKHPMGKSWKQGILKISWIKWKWTWTYQNLWHAEKTMLIEEFIAVNVYIKKKKDPKTIT